jgi:prophage regulatory protein
MPPKPTTPKTPIAASIPAVKAAPHQSTATQTTQKIVIQQSVFDALPDSAFIREAQLVQSPKRPGVAAPLPFSAATFWRMVRQGKFRPYKLSERVTAFNVGEIRAWMKAQVAA